MIIPKYNSVRSCDNAVCATNFFLVFFFLRTGSTGDRCTRLLCTTCQSRAHWQKKLQTIVLSARSIGAKIQLTSVQTKPFVLGALMTALSDNTQGETERGTVLGQHKHSSSLSGQLTLIMRSAICFLFLSLKYFLHFSDTYFLLMILYLSITVNKFGIIYRDL